MVKQQRDRSIPIGIIAGVAATAIATGGGVAWWTWNSAQSPTRPPAPNTAVQPQSPPPASVAAEQTVQVFWLQDTGNNLKLVPQPLATTTEPANALNNAFNRLLSGPENADVSTTIPAGTKLRDFKLEQDEIHVNLSEEFISGGGSAAMTGRVAQVVFTATSLQPTAKVWIEVEGEPLEVLGGEGLELQQPLTRQSFKDNFSL